VLIPVEPNCAWTLSVNRRNVRVALPPLRLAGVLAVYMDFDAKAVDAIMERFGISRS
jgi:hypothetical protein